MPVAFLSVISLSVYANIRLAICHNGNSQGYTTGWNFAFGVLVISLVPVRQALFRKVWELT